MQISIFHADFEKVLKLAKPKTDLEDKFLAFCQEACAYAKKFKTCVVVDFSELKLLESFCQVEPTRTLNEILYAKTIPEEPSTIIKNSRPDLKPVES